MSVKTVRCQSLLEKTDIKRHIPFDMNENLCISEIINQFKKLKGTENLKDVKID